MSYCFNPACHHPHNSEHSLVCVDCGAKLLLGDRYRVIKPLGAGGFGRTFLAVDEYKPSKPPCVIKQFFPQHQGTSNLEKATELFHQEAMRLEQLGEHPQIPHLLAYFIEGNQQYLVQEFIDGQNLEQELAEQGAFSELQIREMLKDLLPILQYIHHHQVIHRDIKPENIIRRSKDGKLILVDFGAAKYATGTALQKTGTVIGSAAYTAPEQLLGKAGFASDIYSLGVTCIHLLTQIPPFDLFDNIEGNWVWRDFLRTPISSQLAQLLDKMLETAIKNRYRSIESIITTLNSGQEKTNFVPILLTPKLGSPLPSGSPSEEAAALVKVSKTRGEFEQILREKLTQYWVNVKIHWGKNHLTVVLYRSPDTPINYSYLLKEIKGVLQICSFPEITRVKVYGMIQNQAKPEWKHLEELKSEAALAPLRLLSIADYQKQGFWLTQFQQKRFWLNLLSFALMSFVLGFRIVLIHPLIGILTAIAFIGVKNWVKSENLNENQLFTHVIASCLMLGFLNLRIPITDGFAILLAAFIAASPLFYMKTST